MHSYLKNVILLLCLIASAYVSVTLPISEKGIPFTAQSLAVFVIAGTVRPRDFLIIIATYLLLGIAGLPVFADGSAGWEKIIGGSGGFLYGFLFSGLVISYMINGVGKSSLWLIMFTMLISTLVLFVFGLGHLFVKYGAAKAIEYGLVPFWKMALVKAVLAGIVVFWSKQLVLGKIKA